MLCRRCKSGYYPSKDYLSCVSNTTILQFVTKECLYYNWENDNLKCKYLNNNLILHPDGVRYINIPSGNNGF